MQMLRTMVCLVSCVAMASCGGGSGSGANTDSAGPPTVATPVAEALERGTFRDSPVGGLRYLAYSSDGRRQIERVTNSGGGYEYFPGGTVQFYYGGTLLGQEVPGSAILSTSDIVKSDAERINIARFLQSADSDGNPNNGLSMPPAAQEKLAQPLKVDFGDSVNFTAQLSTVATSAQLRSVVSAQDAGIHSASSDQLSAVQDMRLGRAISGRLNYPAQYNLAVLSNSELARVHLYVWQSIVEPAILGDVETLSKGVQLLDATHGRVIELAKKVEMALDITNLAFSGHSAFKKLVPGERYSFKFASQASVGVQGRFKTFCAITEFGTELACGLFEEGSVGSAGIKLLDQAIGLGGAAFPEIIRKNAYTIKALPGTVSKRIVGAIVDPTFYATQILSLAQTGVNFGAAWSITGDTKDMNNLLAAHTYLDSYYKGGLDDAAAERLLGSAIGKILSNSSYTQRVQALADYYNADAAAVENIILNRRADLAETVRAIEKMVGGLSNVSLQIGTLSQDTALPAPPVLSWNLEGLHRVTRCFALSAVGSHDPAGAPLSLQWVVSSPIGFTKSFTGTTVDTASSIFGPPGNYSVKLTATNSSGLSTSLKANVAIPLDSNVTPITGGVTGSTNGTGNSTTDVTNSTIGTVNTTVKPIIGSTGALPITSPRPTTAGCNPAGIA